MSAPTFKFDATGQLNPPVTSPWRSPASPSTALRSATSPSTSARAAVSRNSPMPAARPRQQPATERLPGRSAKSISVGNNGASPAPFQRPELDLAGGNSAGAFQQRQRSQRAWMAAPTRSPTCPAPALAGASGWWSASRSKAPTPTSPTEFTKLIVTQQAYSAPTPRSSPTANQMSQDLLNILR